MTTELKIEDIIKAGRLDQDDLKELRSWADTLGATEIPDEMLALALMACDRNQESARNTIRAYFKIKNSAPEMFNNLCIDDEDIKSSCETLYYVILPRRTPNNLAIAFERLHDSSYRRFNNLSHIRRVVLLFDCLMKSNTFPDGIISVIDVKDFPVTLIPKIHVGELTKLFRYLQEGFLLKIHSIHFINAGLAFKYLMNIFRFAIRGDLLDKITCYSNAADTEEFYRNYLPPECRPSDYGGTLPSLGEINRKNSEEMRQFKNSIVEEQKLREKYKDLFCCLSKNK